MQTRKQKKALKRRKRIEHKRNTESLHFRTTKQVKAQLEERVRSVDDYITEQFKKDAA